MNPKYSVSIEKNTNKLISSSEDKFVGIGEGSLIKLGDDSTLYNVTGKTSFFYIKDFIIHDSKIIIINDDVGINLQKHDRLRITYKEYGAKFIVDIINRGKGFSPNDAITVKGGVLSSDISSGSTIPTVLNIVDVNGQNGVEQIEIKEPGKYITPPENPISVYGKRGDNLSLDIKYTELSNRSFMEREISDIYLSEGKTFIVLDYSLPPNLNSGKISCDKNTLQLSQNYTGETKKNLNYQVFTSFTPNLKLPMLLKNSLSFEAIYNKSCLIIDEEIGKIKKHLGIK